MNINDQLRLIRRDFDLIAAAVGKEKEPLVSRIEHTDSGRALRLLLDPAAVFHLDKKSLSKSVNLLPVYPYPSLFALCHALMEKKSVTDQDIADIQGFISNLSPDVGQFVSDFLCKSIRLGVTVKTLNKCFEEKVPIISCMLAKKYADHPHALDGQQFAITEKLDGIRCMAVVRRGHPPVLYSRQGKRIEGLTRIEKELTDVHRRTGQEFVADGELLIEARNRYESKIQYKMTTRIVRKSGEKTGIVFNVFDVIGIEAFDEQCCEMPYYLRRQRLETLFCGRRYVLPVPVLYMGDDVSQIAKHLDIQRKASHEGVMINLLSRPYVFGRTDAILKVKVMQDADLEVIGVAVGEGKFANTLGSLIVRYKGNEVGVGSGLSNAMRDAVWKNPDAYIGRIARIRYFEETQDKHGNVSIRFPVFEEFREEGKEVSYD